MAEPADEAADIISYGAGVARREQFKHMSPYSFHALVQSEQVKEDHVLYQLAKDPENIRKLVEMASKPMKFGATSKVIETVALLVVVPAELEPIEKEYGFQRNLELEKKFCGQAARIMSGRVESKTCTAQSSFMSYFSSKPGYDLHIIAFATCPEFGERYNSGPTQAGALASLVACVIKPDLAISFGTAGGFLDGWDEMPKQRPGVV